MFHIEAYAEFILTTVACVLLWNIEKPVSNGRFMRGIRLLFCYNDGLKQMMATVLIDYYP